MPVETIDRLAAMLDAEAGQVSVEVDILRRLLPPPGQSRAAL
jgi:hypothetical protein